MAPFPTPDPPGPRPPGPPGTGCEKARLSSSRRKDDDLAPPGTVIFVELAATGYNPSRDRLFELAAVKITGGEEVAHFQTLADPGVPLPLAASRATGVTRSDLDGAPSPAEAAGELLAFASDGAVGDVAEWASYEADVTAAFLVAATDGLFSESVLGIADLARVVAPSAPGHRPEALAEHLGTAEPATGSLDRARWAAAAYAELVGRLRGFDLALLGEISWILAKERSALARLIHDVERAATKAGFGKKPGDFLGLLHQDQALKKNLRPERREPAEGASVDADAAARHLEAGGSVAGILPDYEDRPEQAQMAREVADALSGAKHLMIEAGTGVGKSLGYLIPAALWTGVSGRPVIVSTNTKNLQAQLFSKDLPLVAKALDAPLRTALLKGRGNYLCVRKLAFLLSNAEREVDPEERQAFAALLVWAAETRTGDISENTGLLAMDCAPSVIEKITTIGDECMSTGCRQASRCFLRAARYKALRSDIVVANHALVFAELGLDTPVLPPYEEIIFDEAHNIEDVATEHLAVKVNAPRVYRILNRLWRRRRRRAGGTGLLATVHHGVGSVKNANPARVAAAREATQKAIELVRPVSDAAGEFFDSLGPLLGPKRSDDEKKRRYGAEKRPPDLWAPVFRQKEEFVRSLAALSRSLEGLLEAVGDLGRAKLPYGAEIKKEMEARLQFIREIITDTEFVLEGKEESYVYWAERVGGGGRRGGRGSYHGLSAAPIHLGQLLGEQLYGLKRSCILTSATMTVGGSFDFLAGRLGMDLVHPVRLKCVDVGTPFDFDRQSVVYVPEFLPEPGDDGRFVDELGRLLVGLFRATQGRGMALFTSYRMLGAVYERVKEPLEAERILVLGQGRDGSRERILETFARERESVLLGTASFWEGVDVKGESLSVLVLAKLPFQVFTEPVVKARCEQVEATGHDAFMSYSVPTAVLRLRQGFGRLIRGRDERGAVIICDRRLMTRRYGSEFLGSLPTDAEPAAERAQLIREIEGFLLEG